LDYALWVDTLWSAKCDIGAINVSVLGKQGYAHVPIPMRNPRALAPSSTWPLTPAYYPNLKKSNIREKHLCET
jgi:hypothetical protein